MSNPIKTIESNVVYENKWLRLRVDRISRGNSEGSYSVVERNDSSIIIPITPSGKTILLRQFRYPTSSFSWELPMGGIDIGEDPENAARRELFEETKLDIKKIYQVGNYFAVPGLTPQRVYIFIAEVTEDALVKAYVPAGADDIQDAQIVTVNQAYKMVKNGEITDGFTLNGLLFLKLHNEK